MQDEDAIEVPNGPLFPEFNYFDHDRRAMALHNLYIEAVRLGAVVNPPTANALLTVTGY